VQRLWSANQIKPHLVHTFKLSKDPAFEPKFWDVIGLYLDPPDKALVLCCDKKSQCHALERTQPGLPLGVGHIRTKTHNYTRHGTITLFAALSYLDGKIFGQTARQCLGSMTDLPGVSVIVLNYNYGRFLTAAIDSALSQDHPLCEVIVVDDGSTDNSRSVIASYGVRIRSVLQEANIGQISALKGAWPLARHPILIILDADDVLLPHAATTVARRWTPATVKTQFPLISIDASGRQLGHISPKYPPNLTTETIRTELLRTGGSPNSPGSGNAYGRSLLEMVARDGGFEFDNPREYHMDAILECNAPFYGEVATIYEPLACYRMHNSNLWAITAIDPKQFSAKYRTFLLKNYYLAHRCGKWGIPFNPAAAANKSIWPLECRLIVDKLAPGRDPLREPIQRTLSRALKACADARLPLSNRIMRAAWFAGVAITPRTVARRLIALRFVVTERPSWFEQVLTSVLSRK
jgi:hypothetical protein